MIQVWLRGTHSLNIEMLNVKCSDHLLIFVLAYISHFLVCLHPGPGTCHCRDPGPGDPGPADTGCES